jgi:hypothetical protein
MIGFAQLSNDLCSSALDLQELLSQSVALAGPYSNVGATGNDINVDDVTGCWVDHLTGDIQSGTPQIDATVWFRFEGLDGNLSLFVQPCDSNLNFLSQDTQMILYRGECDSLEVIACNEDIDAAANYYWSGITTEIQAGDSYYLAVDGFNYSGFGSPQMPLTTGEFCLSTQQPEVSVVESSSLHLAVFPNPTDGKVTLNSESPIMEVAIFDVYGARCGHQIVSNSMHQFMIELPESSGFYFVHARTKRGVVISRVIRN